MTVVDEAIREFLAESYENLQRFEDDLLAFEKDPEQSQLITRVFRTVHTIKGTCGFLGYRRLERLTHAGEGLLSILRDGELKLNRQMVDALLKSMDLIRIHLQSIEASGDEADVDDQELIDRIAWLAASDPDHPIDQAGQPPAQPRPAKSASAETRSPDPAIAKEQKTPKVRSADADVPAFVEVQAEPAANDDEDEHTEDHLAAESPGIQEHTIRVDVGVLDQLMNQLGELVLVRNQIAQLVRGLGMASVTSASNRLNLVTGELQEGLMKTRMQPISKLWTRLPRLVRDTASQCKKKVQLELRGQDTELDRTVLESIRDPLTHLVRNAIAHGIEIPEIRTRGGKSPVGNLTLKAHHQAGHVMIEVSDDGRGIDPDLIARRAVGLGLCEKDETTQMSVAQKLALIFLPGFTTVDRVTNIAGRGIGMDVVRNHIEQIGGTIEIESEVGQGTCFFVRIPLTLAVIPALVVHMNREAFAVPQANVIELVRLEGTAAQSAIEYVHDAAVYRLRGQLVPIISLRETLALSDTTDGPNDPVDEVLNIMVVGVDNKRFGIIVDQIFDAEEVVVKPLGPGVASIPVYGGATIMGDGSIALILDIPGLAGYTGVLSDDQSLHQPDVGPGEDEESEQIQLEHLLLFRGPDAARMAVPLDNVERLEKIPTESVEYLGNHRVTQYHGSILNLRYISEHVEERRTRLRHGSEMVTPESLDVIVLSKGEARLGIVVAEILDIVSIPTGAIQDATREGVQGCTVVNGQITEVIDTERIWAGVPT